MRVVKGKKAEDDLRFEWQVPGGEWRAVTMAAGGIMADFWYENEDVLYPPSAGFLGGEKYAQYLDQAMREGWDAADAVLQGEKAASRTSATPTLLTWCREHQPEGSGVCTKPKGHAGPHMGPDYVWPQSVAS
jgi:hypothetical protein